MFSFNPAQQREKVKFVLDDGYQCHAVYRPCVLGALTAVRCACESSITTDKGHRSSTGKTTVEFWLQQHVYEGAEIVPEDVSFPSPAEEVIDPSTPLSPEGGPYDPSSVVSSLNEMTMASPMTPVSKRVRFDSSENATLAFNIEQEVCVDAAANSASSSQSAGLLQTSLAALSDEYVALQSDMIWEKLQPRLEDLFKGLRGGDMPSTLRQVFDIQRRSTSEDVADALMPESKDMLVTILKNRIDFDGMVGAMTEVPEVRELLAPRYAAPLETEIDKMVSFASASLSKPTDANSGSQLAPVSSRGMVQSKKKGRKK